MNIRLFDPPEIRASLLPLTFTRAVASLRFGIDTILEKWQAALPGHAVYAAPCDDYLMPLYPAPADTAPELSVAGNLVPTPWLVEAVLALAPEELLTDADGTVVAMRGDGRLHHTTFTGDITRITDPTSIFLGNGRQLALDFERITAGRTSAPVDPSVTVIGPADRLFIEPGASLTACIVNLTEGPVYVGRDAVIAEGCCVRGPLALLDGSHINMGAKVYPDTTIGPHCKVGGEVNNVVFQGYSNKAHDGFLGNSVIGEWCNLGAGCTSSNLKNDYSPIRLYSYVTGRFNRTGLQFCGLIMGDHSKAGINTMFNTATVVGVGCNIHGGGFPRPFIPSFSDGGAAGFTRVVLSRMLATARTVMARRDLAMTPAQEAVITHLYSLA